MVEQGTCECECLQLSILLMVCTSKKLAVLAAIIVTHVVLSIAYTSYLPLHPISSHQAGPDAASHTNNDNNNNLLSSSRSFFSSLSFSSPKKLQQPKQQTKQQNKQQNKQQAKVTKRNVYEYVGCYKDSKDNRALPHLASQSTTVASCAALAEQRKSPYFALQFGFECWLSGTNTGGAGGTGAGAGAGVGNSYGALGESSLCEKCSAGSVEYCAVWRATS